MAKKLMGFDPAVNTGQAGVQPYYWDGTQYVSIDNVFRRYSLIESYGEYFPAGRFANGTGLLKDFTVLCRNMDIGVDSNSAYHIMYTHTTLSVTAGIIIIDRQFLVRNQNFYLKLLFISRVVSAQDERAFIGFGPNNLIPETDTLSTLFPDGVACYCIGHNSTDSTYKLYYNDTSGPVNVVDTTVPVPSSLSVNYFLELTGSNTNMSVTIRDFAGNVLFTRTDTTEIPGTTANLYWHSVVQQAAAVGKNMSFRGMFVKARGY